MKSYLLLLFSIVPIWLFSQKKQAGISFTNASSHPFILFLNEVQINQQPVVAIRVIGLKEYSYKIKIITPDVDVDEINISKLYVCNNEGKMKESGYQLSQVNQHYNLKKIYFRDVDSNYLPGYTNFVLNNGSFILFENVASVPVADNKTITDTSTFKSVQKVQEERKKDSVTTKSVKLAEPVVKNASTTPPLIRVPDDWVCQHTEPLQSVSFLQLMDQANQIKKQDKLYRFISETIASACFTTAQLQSMVSLLNSESYRLDVLKKAFPHTTDIRNYYDLRILFTDGRNKAAFNKFITAW